MEFLNFTFRVLKGNWSGKIFEGFWKALEKLVVVYKLIEGVETMFGFFKDIKAAVASVEARVKAVEDKIESLFAKTPEAPTEQPAAAAEATDAK